MKTEKADFIPYSGKRFDEKEMLIRSSSFYEWANTRRSVRQFSERPVSLEVMQNLILTASTAPSGAHKQPWTFCLISNKELKTELRRLAEEEERKSYEGRMSEDWLKDLEPLGTDAVKEFIEDAPWIVIIMKRIYEIGADGKKLNNYYVSESVGIAAGFFLAAVHHAGLVALTHTPSPMNFISEALKRPENERPFLLIPVGYPADKAEVPNLKRKELQELIEYYP
jgi:iodotyrosine deiodinase